MSTVVVLIILLANGEGVDVQYFASKQACETARADIITADTRDKLIVPPCYRRESRDVTK